MRRRPFAIALALLSACKPEGGEEGNPKISGPNELSISPAHPETRDESPVRSKRSDAPPAAEPARLAASPPDEDPTPESAPRVFAKTRNVWVRAAPSSDAQWIGALWWGGSVEIRGPERKQGAGCGNQWVPVQPRGWVCVDGERATLDEKDPVYLKLVPFRARVESPWPHKYAITTKDVRRFETLEHARPFLEARKGRDAALTGVPAPLLPTLPKGLSERRDTIAARSALAFTSEGDAFGTGLLLAADLSWVPRGDVTIVPPSQFQGVELKGAAKLPLAFFRDAKTVGYKRDQAGEFLRSGETFPRHGHVLLDDAFETVGRARYYRVAKSDLWISNREAVIPDPELGKKRADRATSVEISILGGWLVAFSGETPVYATLISAGRGGGPVKGKDLVSTASTPKGRFEISSKLRTATMESSGGPIVHGDVPWTQNFSGPHAIHTAYWHDDFGELKSAGCVNVSPKDGQWLFDFTEPKVPEGWHAVKYLSRYGGTTRVILHD